MRRGDEGGLILSGTSPVKIRSWICSCNDVFRGKNGRRKVMGGRRKKKWKRENGVLKLMNENFILLKL